MYVEQQEVYDSKRNKKTGFRSLHGLPCVDQLQVQQLIQGLSHYVCVCTNPKNNIKIPIANMTNLSLTIHRPVQVTMNLQSHFEIKVLCLCNCFYAISVQMYLKVDFKKIGFLPLTDQQLTFIVYRNVAAFTFDCVMWVCDPLLVNAQMLEIGSPQQTSLYFSN